MIGYLPLRGISVTSTSGGSFSKKIIFFLIMLMLVVIVIEVVATFILRTNPDIETTRKYLRGEQQMQLDMNSVSQAYLLYIPAPNYVTPMDNIRQNNAEG